MTELEELRRINEKNLDDALKWEARCQDLLVKLSEKEAEIEALKAEKENLLQALNRQVKR